MAGVGERKFEELISFCVKMNSAVFGVAKRDIQNQSFLPSLSHLLLFVFTLDAVKPFSDLFLVIFTVLDQDIPGRRSSCSKVGGGSV